MTSNFWVSASQLPNGNCNPSSAHRCARITLDGVKMQNFKISQRGPPSRRAKIRIVFKTIQVQARYETASVKLREQAWQELTSVGLATTITITIYQLQFFSLNRVICEQTVNFRKMKVKATRSDHWDECLKFLQASCGINGFMKVGILCGKEKGKRLV